MGKRHFGKYSKSFASQNSFVIKKSARFFKNLGLFMKPSEKKKIMIRERTTREISKNLCMNLQPIWKFLFCELNTPIRMDLKGSLLQVREFRIKRFNLYQKTMKIKYDQKSNFFINKTSSNWLFLIFKDYSIFTIKNLFYPKFSY